MASGREGALACAAFMLLAPVVAAQQANFAVGTATAAAGQKATGYITVAPGVDAGTNIPVVLVRGSKTGPVLALVSGAHGTEYASIIALEKLMGRLEPADVSGTLIIVPLVNVASFLEKVPHVNPIDKKNMNRFYPGRADGTQTERALFAITHQVVDRCDYLIDLHGGDLDESLRPYSYWAPIGHKKQDRISREMALAFGLDTIIISTGRPKDLNDSRYLETTASLRGKPSVTVEAGYAGTTETDDIEALVRGCLNVMRYLKMIAGEVRPVEHPVWIEKVATLTSEQEGFFYPLVKRGSYVGAGMKVGYVTDYFGTTTFEAQAPSPGVVLYICAIPSMKKGDTIANIGIVATKAP